MTAPLDCETCGACCCNTSENIDEGYRDYVEIGRRDDIYRRSQLLQTYAERNEEGRLHLRLIGAEQRCAALVGELGRRVRCRIYAWRPHPCRRVKAGDAECERARSERGIG